MANLLSVEVNRGGKARYWLKCILMVGFAGDFGRLSEEIESPREWALFACSHSLVPVG